MTIISDERLAEIVGAGVPCVPIEPWEVAHVVQELRALRAQGGVRVKALEWHRSEIIGWNGDWHTVPTAYSIRCADENGWKWSGFGGFGYERSDEAAKAAAQADYERRILSSLEASPAPVSEEMVERLIEFSTDVGRYSPKIVPMGANHPLFDGMQDDTEGAWLNRVGTVKRIRSFFAAIAAKGGQ